jgi:hypothetical protein
MYEQRISPQRTNPSLNDSSHLVANFTTSLLDNPLHIYIWDILAFIPGVPDGTRCTLLFLPPNIYGSLEDIFPFLFSKCPPVHENSRVETEKKNRMHVLFFLSHFWHFWQTCLVCFLDENLRFEEAF